jgi:hypothetical protein
MGHKTTSDDQTQWNNPHLSALGNEAESADAITGRYRGIHVYNLQMSRCCTAAQ